MGFLRVHGFLCMGKGAHPSSAVECLQTDSHVQWSLLLEKVLHYLKVVLFWRASSFYYLVIPKLNGTVKSSPIYFLILWEEMCSRSFILSFQYVMKCFKCYFFKYQNSCRQRPFLSVAHNPWYCSPQIEVKTILVPSGPQRDLSVHGLSISPG